MRIKPTHPKDRFAGKKNPNNKTEGEKEA